MILPNICCFLNFVNVNEGGLAASITGREGEDGGEIERRERKAGIKSRRTESEEEEETEGGDKGKEEKEEEEEEDGDSSIAGGGEEEEEEEDKEEEEDMIKKNERQREREKKASSSSSSRGKEFNPLTIGRRLRSFLQGKHNTPVQIPSTTDVILVHTGPGVLVSLCPKVTENYLYSSTSKLHLF